MIEIKSTKNRTNADVIRSMTDEQLSEFLSAFEDGDIDYTITHCSLCKQGGNALGYDCDDCIKDWVSGDAYNYNGLLADGINSGYVEVRN